MDGLGVHVLLGETLLGLLQRVAAGEDPDAVYMEMYASADHVQLEDDDD